MSELSILTPFVSLLGFILLILVVSDIFGPSKTRRYRQQLVDMYISGRVRQLAEKDKINLDEEYTKFLIDEKKRNTKLHNLDTVLEDEIKEELVDDFKKK